jgi:membrane peptidoglycan carboxypeptidase
MSHHDDYDDDVPFHLPKEPGYEGDIHKGDTEDIVIPPEFEDEPTEPRMSRPPADDDEIARLHASDPPLAGDRPEDDPMFRRPPADPDANTVTMTGASAVDASQFTQDMDVPFRLPKERPDDSDDEPDQPVGNKWMTMPSKRTPSDRTLPGSGGLDPNPDFNDPKATVQNMRPVNQPTVPHQPPARQNARYQRPAAGAIPAAPGPRQAPGAAQKVLPKQSKNRRRSSGVGCFAIFIGLFVTLCGGFTLITAVLGLIAYDRIDDLVDESLARLDQYTNFQSTFIYDRNGEPLFEVFKEGRRTNVDLDDMPQVLLDATIAIEDDSFYSNIGIDVGATTVAFLQYLGASPNEQTPGGSTITQQLVRNVLFDPEYRAERSVQRKVEEILLAIALNARWSKDDVLELYLNEIYYGNLAYGSQAAAQIFFGKNVGDLTLGEAALLAGLPQAPAELDPLNPDPVIQAAVDRRWRQVLGEMVEEGFITEAERDEALRQGLSFANPNIDLRAPHFTVYAQEELEDLMLSLGYNTEQIALGGLKVYTTVDLSMNQAVTQIAAEQINSLAPSQNVSNASVVLLKPLTGEIMAMVGSIDYNNDAIDGRVNVSTRPRQPGSTMKPFTYAGTMELGFTPGDVLWDTQIRIPQFTGPDYVPRNYDGSFHGPMRMRRALANSYNIPAIQAVRYIGVDYLLQMMNRFGVESLGLDASRYGVSLTLGGGEVTLLELTRAYSVFANGGALVESTAILCVLDNENNVLYEYENGCPATVDNNAVTRTSQTVTRTGLGSQILDPRIAFIISDIMADNAARATEMGSNSDLRTDGITTSVKTGTTDDVKDNWTVGYTRNLAVGVWVGNNNGDPMQNTTGLTGAAPIWNRVFRTVYNNPQWMDELRVDGQLQPDQHNPPPGTSNRRICNIRNLYDPATACASTVNEWFLDTPARLPDGNGNMVEQGGQRPAQELVPTQGTYVQLVDPGVYRTVALELNPAIANAIQFNVPAGEEAPPSPRYCRVPVEAVVGTPGAQELLFIAPPAVPADAASAERYAQSNGLAFLPTIDCTGELLTGGAAGPQVVTAFISSPAPNATLSGQTPIIGTADFSPQVAQFYKIEIIGGQWANWTTVEQPGYQPVVNGQLLLLPQLPSGSYRIRLVVIGLDGGAIQQPYEIPVNVP